jgi:hypothetical protein
MVVLSPMASELGKWESCLKIDGDVSGYFPLDSDISGELHTLYTPLSIDKSCDLPTIYRLHNGIIHYTRQVRCFNGEAL